MLVNRKNYYDPILINGDTLEFVDDMKYLEDQLKRAMVHAQKM